MVVVPINLFNAIFAGKIIRNAYIAGPNKVRYPNTSFSYNKYKKPNCGASDLWPVSYVCLNNGF